MVIGYKDVEGENKRMREATFADEGVRRVDDEGGGGGAEGMREKHRWWNTAGGGGCES